MADSATESTHSARSHRREQWWVTSSVLAPAVSFGDLVAPYRVVLRYTIAAVPYISRYCETMKALNLLISGSRASRPSLAILSQRLLENKAHRSGASFPTNRQENMAGKVWTQPVWGFQGNGVFGKWCFCPRRKQVVLTNKWRN